MIERATILLSVLFAAGLAHAGRPEPATPAIDSFALASAAGEDRVGASAKLKGDGLPDWRFTATVRGNIAALILTVCDGGKHTISQWDTLVAGGRSPPGFYWKDGGSTWVLGVVREGKLINEKNGSLARFMAEEKLELQLHAAQNGFLKSGTKVCLSVIGTDGSVAARAETTIPAQ